MNARDEDGSTPLHLAYKKGDEDIIDALEQAGADTTFRDIYNKKPSDYRNINLEESINPRLIYCMRYIPIRS